VLLVCRFRPQDPEDFLRRARRAVELITAQPGCLDATLAQAIDEPASWLLVARFTSVAAYRRAMSPFPIREHVVPLLAEALTESPSVYEPRLHAADGQVAELTSLIAKDAGTVRLGEAAGPRPLPRFVARGDCGSGDVTRQP
jgi:quinol monooxygenase YgiN